MNGFIFIQLRSVGIVSAVVQPHTEELSHTITVFSGLMCTPAADIRSLHCTRKVYCTRDGHFYKVNEQIEHFKCHYDPVSLGLYIICTHTEFVSKVLQLLQQVHILRVCLQRVLVVYSVRETIHKKNVLCA